MTDVELQEALGRANVVVDEVVMPTETFRRLIVREVARTADRAVLTALERLSKRLAESDPRISRAIDDVYRELRSSMERLG